MLARFSQKVCFVTGAASGIGYAACVAFAREGAKAIFATDVQPGDKVVEAVKNVGGNIIFQHCDVSSEKQVEDAVNRTISSFGSLDVAFNCAGIVGNFGIQTHQADVETFDKVIAVNLRGVFLCLKHEMRVMRDQPNGGAIVNVASVAGLTSNFGNPAYGASKHGVIGLTRTAAAEGAKKKIRVNAVCPGIIETPMAEVLTKNPHLTEMSKKAMNDYPMKRFGQPDEVVGAVLHLASNESSFTTGQFISMDGGLLNSRL